MQIDIEISELRGDVCLRVILLTLRAINIVSGP
jgi:hypothetical protein